MEYTMIKFIIFLINVVSSGEGESWRYQKSSTKFNIAGVKCGDSVAGDRVRQLIDHLFADYLTLVVVVDDPLENDDLLCLLWRFRFGLHSAPLW